MAPNAGAAQARAWPQRRRGRDQPGDLQTIENLVPLVEQFRVGTAQRAERVDRRRDVVLEAPVPRRGERVEQDAARCPRLTETTEGDPGGALEHRPLPLRRAELATGDLEAALRVTRERLGLRDQRLREIRIGVQFEPPELGGRRLEDPDSLAGLTAADREPAEEHVRERHRLPLARGGPHPRAPG